jgi:hypothetical protein
VAAVELGLQERDWEESQELEAFLSYPFDIKETIEKRGFCTGAQGMMLLYDLKAKYCSTDASLKIKEFPTTLSMAGRERRDDKSLLTTKEEADLCSIIITARSVMQDELNQRLFVNRPSNSRLVQAYMSKQMPSSLYLTEAQNTLARSLYLKALRDAVSISRVQLRPPSPPHVVKKQKVAPSGGMLFRGEEVVPAADDSPAAVQEGDDFDPVYDEVKRWEYLGREQYNKFYSPDGLLNEFAMMWALRVNFPLHYIIFKMTASHLPHEGNVEQIFSRAGLLADPNLQPAYLGTLVKIGVNKKSYKPPLSAILDKYFEMFRGSGEKEDGMQV